MPKHEVRGVQDNEIIKQSQLTRDTRTGLQQILAWIGESQKNLGLFIISWAVFLFFFPALWLVGLIFFGLMTLAYADDATQKKLPLRLPMNLSKTIDYNSPNPGRRSYKKGSGIFYLGQEFTTKKELWAAANDMLTHMLVFGTTGAGKTEFLTGLCTNSVTNGAGVIFIDPKGTNTLWYQLYLLSRITGRDDDALVINFSTGGKKVEKFSPDRKSNTLNPFTTGTAESLFDLLSAFVPASEGDNAVFSQRALAFMSALMYPLAYLRDEKVINLSIATIREYLPMDKVIQLAGFPVKKPINGIMIPDDVVYPLKSYLMSVAGFDATKEKQAIESVRQHDFAQAYFTRPLASMMDTYGFIYGCDMGEIDYRDVVYNRRILCILLPAMEKSAPELKQAGNMILQGIKGAISLGLGDKYEGSVEQALLTLPSSARVPTLMIADEYGYVATEGFAVIPAQARGLGFSFVFAGQDYAGFKRGSETEAEQIVANTKIKVLMALEDPQSTFDLFEKLAGRVTVSRARSYEIKKDSNSISKDYKDGGQAEFTERSPLDILDLKGQIEGEFHMFYRDQLIRGQSFHADLDPKKMPNFRIKVLRGLEVKRPTQEYISKKHGKLKEIKQKVHLLFSDANKTMAYEAKDAETPLWFDYWSNSINKVNHTRQIMETWFSSLVTKDHDLGKIKIIDSLEKNRKREPIVLAKDTNEDEDNDIDNDFITDILDDNNQEKSDASHDIDILTASGLLDDLLKTKSTTIEKIKEAEQQMSNQMNEYPHDPLLPSISENTVAKTMMQKLIEKGRKKSVS